MLQRAFKILLFVIILYNTVWATLDENVSQYIEDRWHSPAMDKIMAVPNFVSSVLGISLGNLSVFYLGQEKEVATAKLAITAWGFSAGTTFLLKAAFNRPRPSNTDMPRYNSSFPSGHTASWFSQAIIYSAKYPRLTIPLYVFGAFVGLSRIYYGEHYFTDVLAGAAVGSIAGYMTLKLENHLRKIPFLR
ncbi:MAG: phosphatase PAP2 family protein [candidate division WOR-3 bacterium]